MSFKAVRWAMDQPIKNSSAKFVLVTMADFVNASESDGLGSWVSWPSITALSKATAMDRKTVMAALQRLLAMGYIEDSGEPKRGATKQITAYRLRQGDPTKSGLPSAVISSDSDLRNDVEGMQRTAQSASIEGTNSAEIGTVEVSQKRNSTENGTVPDFPANSTVFPYEQSRFSLETVPKTGHGIKKEQRRNKELNREERARSKPAVTEIPDVPAELLADYLAVRKAKKAGPLTPTAVAGLLREAGKAGLTAAEAVTECCEAGWQGFRADWYARRRGLGPSLSAARQPSTDWWTPAGFPNVHEAENARCFAHNAHQFRDGKRLPQQQQEELV
ncbi:helix-turn-helix domain-containing protein [Ottowia testudinis]|uniref:Helix-turn-helix domain-containing protein n=1 Tax=Ottowia testudinis TaxID=2816950 RepID=A0A975CI15_9BURK|nr:helix-turn-helix domain-containing protein [Ottowia testudinis]QTD44564.1 helix-turn-helix domain-containing protein [Ottowia testudinis]